MDTLFYAEPGSVSATHIRLAGEEAHHASRVLRCRVGDLLEGTDGQGGWYRGQVESITRSEVVVRVSEVVRDERGGFFRVLAVGLIRKRDRLEFLLEKATELGVDHFVLFSADHSEKGSVRTERLMAVLMRAMKQSRRTFLPGLSVVGSLDEVLRMSVTDDEGIGVGAGPGLGRFRESGEVSGRTSSEISDTATHEASSKGFFEGSEGKQDHIQFERQQFERRIFFGDLTATTSKISIHQTGPRTQPAQSAQPAQRESDQPSHPPVPESQPQTIQPIIGCIGPEGGWSAREQALLHKEYAQPISLGSHRLRTETAGIIMADRLASFT